MNTSFKIYVEKISNGYLSTNIVNDVDMQKTFNQEKPNFHDLLKENKIVEQLMGSKEEKQLFEIIKHDLEFSTPEKTIDQLKKEVIQQEKFSPFKHKEINVNELRLSVTKKNAYSIERLKAIDWVDLDKQLPLSMQSKAEIVGKGYGTLHATLKKAGKGECLFQSIDTRMYMTVLAKYYEAVLGVRSSKKDELDKLKIAINDQIEALNDIFKRNCLVHTNNLAPIIFAFEQLIGKKSEYAEPELLQEA